MLETPTSISAEMRNDQTWASAGYKLAQANATEKLIEAKERELQQCIVLNYSKVKEVEKELATLQFQLKLTSGPKRSALEMFRKKIEAQNACVVAARDRHRAAKKVFESSEEALRTEERIKDQLCQELNLLVQQSAHAQIEKLEQLTQRLEYLNQGMQRGQGSPGAVRADSPEQAQHSSGPEASPARPGTSAQAAGAGPPPTSAAGLPVAPIGDARSPAPPSTQEQQQQQQQQQEAAKQQRQQEAARQRAEQLQRSRQEASAARSNHVSLAGGGSQDAGRGSNAARQPGNRRQSGQAPAPADKLFQGFE